MKAFHPIVRLATALMIAAVAWSCGPKAPPQTQVVQPQPVGEADLKRAVDDIAKDLAMQIGRGAQPRTAVIDPLLERATGQQTLSTRRVQEELAPALSGALTGVTFVPFDADGAAKSRLVVTG